MYQSFSKRQMLAMTWWNRPGLRNYEGIICDGAIRSGKTLSMVTGFFLWSMANFHGNSFALCGRTVGALRRNIIANLYNWLGDTMEIRENRSAPTVSARKNANHPVVKFVQMRLAALGYTQVGEADGVAGAMFDAAMKAFQQDNGCAADGEATAQKLTWRKLLGME